MKDIYANALSVFPRELKEIIGKAVEISPTVYEIRLIAENSVFFYTACGIRFVTSSGTISITPSANILIPTFEQLENIVNRAIGFSGFSHERELKEGYITYFGAYRMGLCTLSGSDGFGHGKTVSIAVRIPCDIECDYGDEFDLLLRNIKNGMLIAGAPASGKTTMLRYIARRLSQGVLGEYKKVTVIDERYELSSGYFLGNCTDVLCGKEKAAAIVHAVRTLSPHFIVCDEIGTLKEAESILDGLNSGVGFIASVHARNMQDLSEKELFRVLYEKGVFDSVVFLSEEKAGKVKKIYSGGELDNAVRGNCNRMSVTRSCGSVCKVFAY